MISDLKLLVVEDSEDLIELWRSLFSRAGVKARFSKRGRDAIAFIEEGYHPDVLMTDFYLPDMTGAEVITAIRNARRCDPKCLVVTGNTNSDFRSNLPDDIEVLVKPVRFEKLMSKIKSLHSTFSA